jgi:hypothetical protein
MAPSVVVWGYLAWSGWGFVKATHASRGQVEFHLVFPLFMVAIALVLPLVLRRWSNAGRAVLIGTLFLLIPYGFVLTRGA